ncbi:hypothetical protein V0R50_15700 [Pseudomonas sp. 148P]|uniref:TPR repeat-containing protein n=1 Tax=Pseudomonas ulcerans TaxID=3115852 RepID=A0ABU7HT24_9PSED|nr:MULTISPECIES: hypothetical protein [unclassified Pseudomonas]MEE1926217.1 hypothetical protein [Pseudomonas sp. 147P]MEE1934673.1 hypothetical protein [Pseudomonas sp. 148P]
MERTTSVRMTVACALLASLPLNAMAHGGHGDAGPQGKTFTRLPENTSLADALKLCVSEKDTEEDHLLSGLGGTRYDLVAVGDSEKIQAFYSQGMALQYGFNFSEAIRAFYQAYQLDKSSAMPLWGIALSASSNINTDATEGCDQLAYLAVNQAQANADRRVKSVPSGFTKAQVEREAEYASAFLSQYDVDGDHITLSPDGKKRYVKEMKKLSSNYFDDLDAAALYADALLNIDPWKWWKGSEATSDAVKPTDEAADALEVLNRVLVQDQNHSGANHFFIHAIEESPFPDSGMPMAERFRTLNPAVGHLIHMASHIYQRTGNNALSSATNYAAISVDRAYGNQVKPQSPYLLHYLGHNIHFLTWTLSIEGRKNEALNMASELVDNTTENASLPFLCEKYPAELKTKSDYFYAVPYYYAVRFQAWDELKAIEPKIKDGLARINTTCAKVVSDWKPLTMPYTRIMQSYAAAYQALDGKVDSGKAIAALDGFWKTTGGVLDETRKDGLNYGNNKAVDLLRLANLILFNKAQDATAGKLVLKDVQETSARSVGDLGKPLADDLAALKDDDKAQVLSAWRTAVKVQDGLWYNEPPDWYYTVRESLGYALLAQEKYEEAERVFTEDLSENRLSGRSLNGLKLALQKQPGKTVSAELEQKLSNAWRNATVSAKP